jgi:hypothetical protein
MSSDIQKQVAKKLYDGKNFSLQLDKSTDISQKCQLLSYIRFLDRDSVVEHFLPYTELPVTSTGFLLLLLLLFVCLVIGHSLFPTKSSFGERDCPGKVTMW